MCIFVPIKLIRDTFWTRGFLQKQPVRGVISKRWSENMQQIYRRTPIPKCDSPVNLLHIFRTPFPKNTSWWLLLFIIFAFLGLKYFLENSSYVSITAPKELLEIADAVFLANVFVTKTNPSKFLDFQKVCSNEHTHYCYKLKYGSWATYATKQAVIILAKLAKFQNIKINLTKYFYHISLPSELLQY